MVGINKASKKQYGKNLWGIFAIGGGAFLIIEHIWNFGEFTFWDFIGHEWLGFLLIILGIGLNVNWSKEGFSSELKNIFKWNTKKQKQ